MDAMLQEVTRLFQDKTPFEVLVAANNAPGWSRLGAGAYKTAWANQAYVVKLATMPDMEEENNEHPHTIVKVFESLPEKLRVHVAKPVFYGNGYVVQERVPTHVGACSGQCETAKASLIKAFKDAQQPWRMTDAYGNHGHLPDGLPVWFDGF